MTLYLKVLNEDRSSYHGGQGVWPPEGEWTPEPLDRSGNPGPLVPCGRGWHLIEPKDIVSWIGPALWEAEYEGEIVHDTDKVVVRKARLVRRIEAWNTRTLSLWAADCAEQTLGNFESLFPDDRRPRQAIEAVRGYAAGEIGLDELRSAASAAWASRASVWAAWAAESAAWAAESAAWAAAEAARSAARSAEAAVRSAARSAVRSAARSAVRSAAWSAEVAAWSAEAAAWSASSAASERDWQADRLLDLIGIKES